MRHLKTTLAVLGAVTILVLAGNTIAMAATGKSFILGKTNYANTATTVKRTTNGQALKVLTRRSVDAPLVVNGRGKVGNLNADLLDGLDSSALAGVRAKIYRYAFTTSAATHMQNLPDLAPGVYLATLNIVLSGASGTTAAPTGTYCQLLQSGTSVPETQHGIVQDSNSGPWDPIINSATVLTTAQGNHLKLYCSSTKAWTSSSSYPAEVTLTKLDGATIGAPILSSGRTASNARSALR